MYMCVCVCVCVCVCIGKSLSLQHLRAGVAALNLSPPVSQQNLKMVFDSMDSDGKCQKRPNITSKDTY